MVIIQDYAFAGNEELTKVNAAVWCIGDYAFDDGDPTLNLECLTQTYVNYYIYWYGSR